MADFAMAMKKKLADINVHSFNDFKMKVGKWNTLSSINSLNSLLDFLSHAMSKKTPKQKGIFAKQESSCSFVKLGAQYGRRFVITT